jgi:transposase
MSHDNTVFVGLDVHKDSIVAACSVGMGEVSNLGKLGVLQRDVRKLCQRVQSKASDVVFVYEAGPCGYGLQRQLQRAGFTCHVCAPSLIPRKAGDRVKTDRRDAEKLVRALRADELSFVHVPDETDEAFRDLVRAWNGARQDLRQAKQRLKSFLLVHGVRYEGNANWKEPHRRWLARFSFPQAWSQMAFEEHRRTVAAPQSLPHANYWASAAFLHDSHWLSAHCRIVQIVPPDNENRSRPVRVKSAFCSDKRK